jgi:hypothetical protein
MILAGAEDRINAGSHERRQDGKRARLTALVEFRADWQEMFYVDFRLNS